jgi:7-keto-8-aminopelargonate synthetase-like enzyme
VAGPPFENLGPSLMFSIQLPPAVLGAICASAQIHLDPEITTLQAQLAERVTETVALLRAHPVLGARPPATTGDPTPGLRITINRAHTSADVRALVDHLAELVVDAPRKHRPVARPPEAPLGLVPPVDTGEASALPSRA